MTSSLDKNDPDYSDWEVRVIPRAGQQEHVFTFRTHQILVEKSSTAGRITSKLGAIFLVLSTIAVLAFILCTVLASIYLLDNLQVINIMQTQTVPSDGPLGLVTN